MNFKDFWLMTEKEQKEESKGETFCYMLYLNEEEQEKILKIQKSLNIDADDITVKKEFHCTVRYVKLKEQQNPDDFVEYLKTLTLPILSASTVDFKLFDNGNCLVIKLDSQEIQDWFEKIDGWMTKNGYNKSDYPTFKPHITLANKYKGDLPKFNNEEHHLKLKFSVHKVTNSSRKVIFEKNID